MPKTIWGTFIIQTTTVPLKQLDLLALTSVLDVHLEATHWGSAPSSLRFEISTMNVTPRARKRIPFEICISDIFMLAHVCMFLQMSWLKMHTCRHRYIYMDSKSHVHGSYTHTHSQCLWAPPSWQITTFCSLALDFNDIWLQGAFFRLVLLKYTSSFYSCK